MLTASIEWYRAAGTLSSLELDPIEAPTLYLWGDVDATVGRPAAAATGDFVTGPFRMETIHGVGHFITDQAPDAVTTLLLDHLAANAARASSSVP
jgi:pimeloyl-ACP methyl ester carboxylesterase